MERKWHNKKYLRKMELFQAQSIGLGGLKGSTAPLYPLLHTGHVDQSQTENIQKKKPNSTEHI